VRPEDVEISREAREDETPGIIAGSMNLPLINATILTVRAGEHEIHAETAGGESFRAGEHAWLSFKRCHVFDESGTRLETVERNPSHPET
jgi:hypothetical protein